LTFTGSTEFEADTYFPQWGTETEAFLVLSGAALRIVEGQERPLRQWDFVHCPPGMSTTRVFRRRSRRAIATAGSRVKLRRD
jgi:glyoxylate utilization-related uncharacterized protein